MLQFTFHYMECNHHKQINITDFNDKFRFVLTMQHDTAKPTVLCPEFKLGVIFSKCSYIFYF